MGGWGVENAPCLPMNCVWMRSLQYLRFSRRKPSDLDGSMLSHLSCRGTPLMVYPALHPKTTTTSSSSSDKKTERVSGPVCCAAVSLVVSLEKIVARA